MQMNAVVNKNCLKQGSWLARHWSDRLYERMSKGCNSLHSLCLWCCYLERTSTINWINAPPPTRLSLGVAQAVLTNNRPTDTNKNIAKKLYNKPGE